MFDNRHTCRLVFATFAAGAMLLGGPRTAKAEEVSPTGKGIAGGVLLGGEVVVFTEALLGIRSTTAYLVGAGLGAAAGGVGGYFIEQSVSDGRIPAYLLAGGLALLIPGVVIALDQTRYLPTAGAREDKPVTNLPASDPGKPGAGAVVGAEPKDAPAPAAPAPVPQSLIDVRGSGLRMGVPVPEVRPVFTPQQKKLYAVESSAQEVRFPVVNVTF
jgi:hypothetical protein